MRASTGLESGLTGRIKIALKAMGAPAFRQPASFRTGKGRSDLIVPLVCLEVKNKDGVVSPEQDGWLRRMRADGVPAYVVRSVAAAQAAVTLTRKGYCPMADQALELDLSFLDELQPKASEPAAVEATPEVEQQMEALSLDDLVKQVQPETVLPPAEETLAEADSEADALLAQLGGGLTTPASDFNPTPEQQENAMDAAAEQADAALTDKVLAGTLSQTTASPNASIRDIADVIGEIGTLHVKLAGVLRSYASGQDGRPAVEPAKRPRTRRASSVEAAQL